VSKLPRAKRDWLAAINLSNCSTQYRIATTTSFTFDCRLSPGAAMLQ
jgi:hypothetical protein